MTKGKQIPKVEELDTSDHHIDMHLDQEFVLASDI
jgi:hypothetical protein